MWIRRTRLTLAIALLLSIVILAWLAGHPRIYSGHVGRLVTRHVLSDLGLSFSCRDIAGNPLRELRFYDVVMTRDGRGEEFAYLSCDSLDVRYELNSFFSRQIVIPELTLHGPRLSVRRSAGSKQDAIARPARSRAQVALKLDVDRLRVRRGEVDLQDPRFEGQQNFRSIEIESRLRLAGDEARLRVDDFRTQWSGGPYRDFRFAGELSREGRLFRLEETVVQLDSLNVRAAGELELARAKGESARWRVQVEARDLDLGRLLAVIGKPLPVELRVDGQAELQSADEGLRIDSRIAGDLAWFDFDLSRFQALVHAGGIEFEQAEGTFQGARVNAAGRLDTQSMLLQLGGSARGFDLSREWKQGETDWPATEIDGDFHLELGLDEAQQLDVDVSNGRGRLREIEVDSLRGRLDILPERGLIVQNARGICNGTRVTMRGSVSADGIAALDFRARASDAGPWLAERFAGWRADAVEADGSLTGPVDSLQLAVSGLVALGGGPQFSAGGICYDLRWPNLRDPRTLAGELEIEDLQLREWPLGRCDVSFEKNGDDIRLGHLFVERGDSSLVAAGSLRLGERATVVAMDSLRIELGELSFWLPRSSSVAVGRGMLATQRFELQGERGSLRLGGTADLDGELALRIELDETDLGLLNWARLTPFDCSGVLNGSVELNGRADDPRILMNLSLRRAQLGEHHADSLRVVLRGEGGTLWLNEIDMHDHRGRLRGAVRADLSDRRWLRDFLKSPSSFAEHWPSARLEATVSVQDVDIDSWLPQPQVDADRSYGSLRARLDIFGTARRPRVSGQLSVSGFHNQAIEIPELQASVETDSTGVRFERGSIATDRPWLEFSGSWPLLLSASERPLILDDEGLRLSLRSPGPLDLAPLADLFPVIEVAEGTGSFQFLAVGDPRRPRLSGELQVEGKRLRLRDLSEEFREIAIRGSFHDGVFEIVEARAREGEKGRVEATGEVRFDGLQPDDITASIQVHRLLLISVPELRAIVSSDGPLQLSLRRPSPSSPRVPHVEGALTIDRARYTGEFTTAGSEGGATVLQATSTPPWTTELRIALRDQIRVSNSVAELLIAGDVDLTRDLTGLRLRGAAEIASGRVSVARLLDFEITEGRLDFSRGSNLEPIVEITAETDVPVYSAQARELEHVTVRVTGTFAEPKLAFSSQSGYDEKTIINLLAGIPVDEGAESANLEALALRMAGKELTGALNEAIGGIDTIDLSTSAAGDAQGTTRIGLGKYLDVADKPLYLRYTQGLSVSERDIYVEYQLRRRFLLTFEVRRRLRDAATHTELNADLKFRVEY